MAATFSVVVSDFAVAAFLLVAVVDLAAVAFLVVAFLADAFFTAGADSAATTFSLVSFGSTVVVFLGTSTGLTSVFFSLVIGVGSTTVLAFTPDVLFLFVLVVLFLLF